MHNDVHEGGRYAFVAIHTPISLQEKNAMIYTMMEN